MSIHTLDLKFQGVSRAIAVYAIPHRDGLVLVESGPGSTLASLNAALGQAGFALEQVTDVLLTHIHLDHAGAAGALARKGAHIHVHPRGVRHLLNPDKLLASAKRIYQHDMERLWGEFLSVPAAHLSAVEDEEEIVIGGLRFVALDTPGHADHHLAYLFEDACFTGDVGGIRIPHQSHLRVPMPPPDLHIEKWRASIARLRNRAIHRIIPTHFGIFDDPDRHLDRISRELDEVEQWLEGVMAADPHLEEIERRFLAWTEARSRAEGVPLEVTAIYEIANPSWMSPVGLKRYWDKRR